LLIDNKTKKIYEIISEWTKEGYFDIVTGYFTIGGLSYLSEKTNDKISNFRFVIGEIVSTDTFKEKSLDLLNENISISSAFKLNKTARNAVAFLKQDKVLTKTLEPNFCHAKAFIFNKDERDSYYITGSSNLTEAGMGLKITSNLELNTLGQGSSSDYKDLKNWFDVLFDCPQAFSEKTVNCKKVDFKKFLISEIEKVFKQYTPEEIYYKILYELFGENISKDRDDPNFNRQIGKLENTVIYNALFEFQQKGVLSLIKMLQNFNGAILADAVGLGKTWSALAVIKFFQLQGYETILLCPKKLENNWRKFLSKQDSKFEDDKFDYSIRFHTDLQDSRLENYQDGLKIKEYFQSDRPKLFVIDESHNLRNDKSNRYKFLVSELLKKNDNIKVLMLSATPINNSLIDIRNQFKLMVKGNDNGFSQLLDIRNIENTFVRAKKAFNEWRESEVNTIGEFIKKLPADFFKLTDSLIVARTRKMVEQQSNNLSFPIKSKPENIFVTPKQIGNFEGFDEILEHFPPKLSGYQPSFYLEQEKDIDVLHNEKLRDYFLVKMMNILMVKRLESSWYSFFLTVTKILAHHQNALQKIKSYEENKKEQEIQETPQLSLFEDDSDDIDLEEFTIGKKRLIKISDIDKAGKLSKYKKDLKKDIECLDNLIINLKRFEQKINYEISKPKNLSSEDDKLDILIKKITEKQKTENKKIIIFTVYKDTALYLFEQLKARSFQRLAVVTGEGIKTSDSNELSKKFEFALERFAPFTNLFKEKVWSDFKTSSDNLSELQKYDEWLLWLKNNKIEYYNDKILKPIDILISTDVLSEGQNLQDCDMVINYDIHWNPVKIIQRMGRIDRLGSINKIIYGINFWPTDSINSYLKLQSRIEERMTAMKLVGSEINKDFTETLNARIHDEELDFKQKERMLKQMETSWEDIEVSEQGLGFNNLSLESFRMDINSELNRVKNYYENIPKAIYSGYLKEDHNNNNSEIIALLGYPSKPPKSKDFNYSSYDLIYIDKDGNNILLNQKEILDLLSSNKKKNRFIPEQVDKGEDSAIKPLSDAVKFWIKKQAVQIEKDEFGNIRTKMGKSAIDTLKGLKSGNRSSVNTVRENKTVEDKFKEDSFDLISWVLIS